MATSRFIEAKQLPFNSILSFIKFISKFYKIKTNHTREFTDQNIVTLNNIFL